jgi:hypothetical protein
MSGCRVAANGREGARPLRLLPLTSEFFGTRFRRLPQYREPGGGAARRLMAMRFAFRLGRSSQNHQTSATDVAATHYLNILGLTATTAQRSRNYALGPERADVEVNSNQAPGPTVVVAVTQCRGRSCAGRCPAHERIARQPSFMATRQTPRQCVDGGSAHYEGWIFLRHCAFVIRNVNPAKGDARSPFSRCAITRANRAR